MFSYSSDETVIPSLSFTKAELVYLLFVLMRDVPFTNNSAQIELVEARHYLNQIKERVILATHNDELKSAIADAIGIKTDKDRGTVKSSDKIPDVKDLKSRFQTLTEEEILEIITSSQEEAKDLPPKQPQLISRYTSSEPQEQSESSQNDEKRSVYTPSSGTDKETSKKFASLLGAF